MLLPNRSTIKNDLTTLKRINFNVYTSAGKSFLGLLSSETIQVR